jgi:tetratricopeptide (TPR) repeat protein
MANGDYQTAIDKFSRVIQILDEHTHLRADLSKRYIRTLANSITCLTSLGRFEDARKLVAVIRAFQGEDGFEHTDVQLSIFKSTVMAELEICRQCGDFEKGIRDAEESMKKLTEYEGRLHKEQELTFFYQYAYIYFGAGQYSKALFWINKVLNDNENTLRQDVYSYARLFNLAIHFELGNYDLLEYTIKSTVRYLQKRERDFPMEKVIIEYFKRIIKTQPANERKKVFESFRAEMVELLKEPENEVVLKYFDFIQWIDKRIETV